MDLEAALTKLKSGDVTALEYIYDQLHASLNAFVLAITRDKYTAGDIVSDTMVKIYDKAGRYNPGTSPKAWIFAIARNTAYDALRQQNKVITLDDYREVSADHEDYFDDAIIKSVLDDFGDQERQIVILHVMENFKHCEIAEILKIPEGTVRWKYRKTIKALADRLGGDFGG